MEDWENLAFMFMLVNGSYKIKPFDDVVNEIKSRLLQELSEAGYLLIPGDCKATYQEKED